MQSSPNLGTPQYPYNFTQNDPYDRTAPVRFVVPQILSSRDYMQSIRNFQVPQDCFAVWFLGQNGFLLKDAGGPLIGIDLYLTNSCVEAFAHLPFRLERQLPIFLEPEDLDVDLFLTTHSHYDHADPETIRRVLLSPAAQAGRTTFAGPFDALRIFAGCGVPPELRRLLHPGETITAGSTHIQATFALPTDASDLNHTGLLLTFANGLTFYNTGDTAWTERLHKLLPTAVDVCAICINGGFHNLSAMQAAVLVQQIAPRVAIPCHYDMMINNVGSPEMLRVALDNVGFTAGFHILRYYEPWLYRRQDGQARHSNATQTTAQVTP